MTTFPRSIARYADVGLRLTALATATRGCRWCAVLARVSKEAWVSLRALVARCEAAECARKLRLSWRITGERLSEFGAVAVFGSRAGVGLRPLGREWFRRVPAAGLLGRDGRQVVRAGHPQLPRGGTAMMATPRWWSCDEHDLSRLPEYCGC